MPRPSSVEAVGIVPDLEQGGSQVDVAPSGISTSEHHHDAEDMTLPRDHSVGDFVGGSDGLGLRMDNLDSHFVKLAEILRNNDYEGLSSFLGKDGVKVEITPKVGCSSLHYSKFNIANSHGPDGESLLLVAARVSPTMVRVILDFGGDPNHTNSFGDSPLSIAAIRHCRHSIDMLLMAGANMAAAVIKLTSALRMQDDFSDESTFSTRPLQTLLTKGSYLRCKDPFQTALRVRKSIMEVVDIRFEFTTDLAQIIKEGDEFTFELLNCCEVMSEARTVLSESSRLLSLAVARKNKLFVSHPFSQQKIRESWKQNLVRYRSTFQLAIRAFIFPFLLPFLLIYLPFERKHHQSVVDTVFGQCLQFLMTPMVCYITDTANYLIFLSTVLAATGIGINTSIYGYFKLIHLVFIFALARVMIDIDQLYYQGFKQFRGNFWNVLEGVLNLMFTISCIIYMIGVASDPPRSDIILDASYIFALAEFFLVFRWLYYLEITSSKNLGPLIISIKYLLGDVFQFVMVVMLTCCVSATAAIFTIISTVSDEQLMGNDTEQRPERFNDFYTSLVTIVWSTFGIYEYSVSDIQLV